MILRTRQNRGCDPNSAARILNRSNFVTHRFFTVPARHCIAAFSLAGYLLATTAAALHTHDHEHSHGLTTVDSVSTDAAPAETHSCAGHHGPHSHQADGHDEADGPALVHSGCALCDFLALQAEPVELVRLQDDREAAFESCRVEVPSVPATTSHAWQGRGPPVC